MILQSGCWQILPLNLHERLTDVSIECLSYNVFIKKYDRKYTLFYLDPPYYDNEEDYGKDMFSKAFKGR